MCELECRIWNFPTLTLAPHSAARIWKMGMVGSFLWGIWPTRKIDIKILRPKSPPQIPLLCQEAHRPQANLLIIKPYPTAMSQTRVVWADKKRNSEDSQSTSQTTQMKSVSLSGPGYITPWHYLTSSFHHVRYSCSFVFSLMAVSPMKLLSPKEEHLYLPCFFFFWPSSQNVFINFFSY